MSGGELVSHAVPTDPGRSRIFFTLVVPKARASGILKLVLGFMTSKWMLWRDHITRANVLDGDNCFLHLQVDSLEHRMCYLISERDKMK